MIGKVIRIKNHAAVEDRQNVLVTALHVAIPQFQVSTIFFLPIAIKK